MSNINIALNKVTTCSSYVMPYESKRAVNGNTDVQSRWLCNSVPAWMCVDLGQIYGVGRWVVKQMGMSGWRSPDYNLVSYALQGTNTYNTGSAGWVTLDNVAGNVAASTDRKLPQTASYRYFRVLVNTGLKVNPKVASIMELELYPASDDATLVNLMPVGSSLDVPFTPSTMAYKTKINYDATSIQVIPTAADSGASIKVNGTAVASGTASAAIPVTTVPTMINVVVTSADASKSLTYTLEVGKKASPLLSNMVVNTAALNPSFNSTTFNYTASIDYITPKVTLTPTAVTPNAAITVNGANVTSGGTSADISMNMGLNTVTTNVSVDGVTKTYKVDITRLASAYLSSLVVNYSGPRIQPGSVPVTCDHTNTNVSATIANKANQFTITPTAEDATASITVNGTSVVSGGTTAAITFNTNSSNVTIIVSGTGVQRTYQLTVSRS